jgi:hypothetical protein
LRSRPEYHWLLRVSGIEFPIIAALVPHLEYRYRTRVASLHRIGFARRTTPGRQVRVRGDGFVRLALRRRRVR